MLPMPPDLYPAEWVVRLHSGQSREFYCFSTVQILGSCLAMVHTLRLVLYLTGIVTGLDLDDSGQQPTSHALALAPARIWRLSLRRLSLRLWRLSLDESRT